MKLMAIHSITSSVRASMVAGTPRLDKFLPGYGSGIDPAPHAHPDLAKELDRDLRRHFFNGALDFVRSVGQTVCIDVYTYAASDTAYVLA
jgi:hypothetical protein